MLRSRVGSMIPLLITLLLGWDTLANAPDSSDAESTSQPNLLQDTLATLPSGESLSRDANWKNKAAADVRLKLETSRQLVDEGISNMVQAFTGGSHRSFIDWASAVDGNNVPISDEELLGQWQCRSIYISPSGVLSYPFYKCTVQHRDECIELRKHTGSQRMAGCLYRMDERQLVFMQTRGFDRDNDRVDGFLSASNADHLRMTTTYRYGVIIYEFRRVP